VVSGDDSHDDFKPQYKGEAVDDAAATIKGDITSNQVFIYMKVRSRAGRRRDAGLVCCADSSRALQTTVWHGQPQPLPGRVCACSACLCCRRCARVSHTAIMLLLVPRPHRARLMPPSVASATWRAGFWMRMVSVCVCGGGCGGATQLMLIESDQHASQPGMMCSL
jgi:hypothetical protein